MQFLFARFIFNVTENLHHFSNLCTNVWFNTIWLSQYAIIFGLTQCGVDDVRLHLSCVGGWQKVMSLSCHRSCVELITLAI